MDKKEIALHLTEAIIANILANVKDPNALVADPATVVSKIYNDIYSGLDIKD